MPSDITLALTEARSIAVKTTGHEKAHYTVIPTAQINNETLHCI